MSVFLEEKLAGDAVGVTLEREWPVFEIGEQQVRDGIVIIQQIAFGVAFGGIENFVEVREFQPLAIHGDYGLLRFAGKERRAHVGLHGFFGRYRGRRYGLTRNLARLDIGAQP